MATSAKRACVDYLRFYKNERYNYMLPGRDCRRGDAKIYIGSKMIRYSIIVFLTIIGIVLGIDVLILGVFGVDFHLASTLTHWEKIEDPFIRIALLAIIVALIDMLLPNRRRS